LRSVSSFSTLGCVMVISCIIGYVLFPRSGRTVSLSGVNTLVNCLFRIEAFFEH